MLMVQMSKCKQLYKLQNHLKHKFKILENVVGANVSNCIKCKFRTRPLADNHGNVAVESFKLFSFKFDQI